MSKVASIERVQSVKPHPNADKLEVVTVLGYQCIVPLGKYKQGDLCVFIQPDSVLPDEEWAQFYLKQSKTRVKACKLRGEWSMGIVESLSMLPYNIYLEGTEVSDLLGITHYEPPTPQELNAKGILPFSMSKTDEERYQNIDLDQYIGEVVDVTLKVDGQSFTAYYDRETDAGGVCGRTMEYKLDAVNNYTANYRSLDLATKLKHFCIENECSIALRGEQYGKGIQNSGINPHCKLKLGVMFYNVLNLKTMKYEPPESPLYYAKVCEQLGLETVPTLEKNVILTRDTIKKYDEGITGINNNPFEGVVIKGNGFSFKVINKFYDSKK